MSELLTHLKTILSRPSILKPYKRILLLSHMRANTSLFGHILGSNPEVEGYYELHIGYYSWKSFIRQKLLYFASHSPKPSAKFMFDKVLHNEHHVDANLFKHSDKLIFSLRHPASTIPSLMKLYDKVDPTHEYATVEGATAYYSERLNGLMALSSQLEGQYYFFEAEDLVERPDELLSSLSKWLNLKHPLSKEYKTFNKTGEKKSGDSSDNLKQGQIVKKVDSEKIIVNKEILNSYELARQSLRNNSSDNFNIS
ncbi:hypothetical protein QX776_17640 [Alteromonadaceae bacterium BrNp21-10]|nr:hypothetical protein [Alteromonadaceae bacterium BrNp21-10]